MPVTFYGRGIMPAPIPPGGGSNPTWDAVASATSYTLRWGFSSKNYFYIQTGIGTTSYPKASMNLEAGVTYYWVASAIVGGVESELSSEQTITG